MTRARGTPSTAPSDRSLEAFRDRAALPAVRAAAFVPSLPGGFKSFYAHEGAGWSAHLKVDYDDARTKPDATSVRAVSRDLALRGLTAVEVRAYATRKGWHLRVWLASTRGPKHLAKTLSSSVVCGLQDRLGDDPYRVAFNRERIARKQTAWNVLFTAKFRNGKLVSCETFDAELTAKFRTWFGMEEAKT